MIQMCTNIYRYEFTNLYRPGATTNVFVGSEQAWTNFSKGKMFIVCKKQPVAYKNSMQHMSMEDCHV